MKKIWASGLIVGAVALGSSSVFAQDAVKPTATWTQFYAGLGITDNLAQATPDGGVTMTINGSNILAPGVIQAAKVDFLAGYMHQFDHIVVGAEGDLDLGGPISFDRGFDVQTNTGSCTGSMAPCAAAGVLGNLNTLGHVRILAGVPIVPNLLLYGTTGVALANAEIDGVYADVGADGFSAGIGVANATQNATLVGWTIGFGAQYAVTDHISLRGEIYHDSYGSMGYPDAVGVGAGASGPTSSAGGGATIIKSVDLQNTAARAALIVGF